MNWKTEFDKKLYTPQEAIKKYICSGDSIYMGGSGVAITCANALFKVIEEDSLTGIELHMHGPCNGSLELEKYDFTREQFVWKSFFFTPGDRHFQEKGKCSYVPLQYGMLNRYIYDAKPRVAIVLVTPPNDKGYCNIGPYGFTPKGIEEAEVVIAQISKNLPWVNGTSHTIHVSEVDAFVEGEDGPAVVTSTPTNDVEKKIAENILPYIPNGACIQLGIGGIANAVGYGLKEKRHLGVHTEVLTESIVDLIENGNVDNSMKTFKKGVSTIGFVLGTERQNKFIDGNNKLLFCPFEDIVNIRNIASNKNMISINGAVSVDITGQVCAESIGNRQFSGTGGQLDFVRAASMSEGGASFIAMPSTVNTNEGVKSRIVFNLEEGSIITTPRTDVQYVVTEYGCVNLQFKDVYTRVKSLVSIAHPEFREELLFKARKAGMI